MLSVRYLTSLLTEKSFNITFKIGYWDLKRIPPVVHRRDTALVLDLPLFIKLNSCV